MEDATRTGLDQKLELRNWAINSSDDVENERISTVEGVRDKYALCARLLAGPSSNLHYIYDSISQLADQAGNGQDIILTHAQALDYVLNLDQLINESTAYVNTANAELVGNRVTLKQWKSYPRYGDYVGKVFK